MTCADNSGAVVHACCPAQITATAHAAHREEGIAAAKKQVQQELGNRAGVNLLVNNAGRPLTAQPSE